MQRSEQSDLLFAALAKAQTEIEGAAKDSVNPHFRSKYADLSSVMQACKTPLSRNGLAIMQIPDSEDPDIVAVTTVLGHASGQWISSRIVMRPTKADPQGVGSALTYCRRYALAAMVGVCPEDDDAEHASRPQDESPALGRLVKAIASGDALAVYMGSKEDEQGFRAAFGRLNMKDKAKCRELEQAGALTIIDWAEYLLKAKDADDEADARLFLSSIVDPLAKKLLWAAMDIGTQDFVKGLKEHA